MSELIEILRGVLEEVEPDKRDEGIVGIFNSRSKAFVPAMSHAVTSSCGPGFAPISPWPKTFPDCCVEKTSR
tara:strand:+ start:7714 stop:7929 length:216 start_codon:yes stop_codon:yes gene_type:complete